MNALAHEVCSQIDTPLEKRALTDRITPELAALPQRECGEKTAMNAKRMLANIFPFLPHILPFALSISPLLPAVIARGDKTRYCIA